MLFPRCYLSRFVLLSLRLNEEDTMKAISSFLLTLSLIVATSAHAHSRDKFQADMRKLWEDHVTWTRLYIVSAAAGLPDTQVTAQRLLDNQRDIGNAVAQFYGKDAGDKLTALLRDHILTAAALVTAAKAGDQAKVAAEKTKWYKNADDISAFLHGANPENWPLATLQSA